MAYRAHSIESVRAVFSRAAPSAPAWAPSRGRGPRSTSLPPSPAIQTALATARVAFQAPSRPAPRPSTPPRAAANGAAASHTRVSTAPSVEAAAMTASSSARSTSSATVVAPSAVHADATCAAPPAVATTMPSSSPARSMDRGTIRGATLPCMATAVHPKRASLPLPGGSEGAGVTVTPMRTAEMLTQPRFFQRPSGPLASARGLGLLTPKSRWTWVPIPCFLVEHPTAGDVMIDTGMTPAAEQDGARALGRRAAIAYDIRMQPGWASSARLDDLGIDPLGIELVVMTHLHYDHAGAIAQYPHATFVADHLEWDAAVDGGFLQGYVHRLFDRPVDWR